MNAIWGRGHGVAERGQIGDVFSDFVVKMVDKQMSRVEVAINEYMKTQLDVIRLVMHHQNCIEDFTEENFNQESKADRQIRLDLVAAVAEAEKKYAQRMARGTIIDDRSEMSDTMKLVGTRANIYGQDGTPEQSLSYLKDSQSEYSEMAKSQYEGDTYTPMSIQSPRSDQLTTPTHHKTIIVSANVSPNRSGLRLARRFRMGSMQSLTRQEGLHQIHSPSSLCRPNKVWAMHRSSTKNDRSYSPKPEKVGSSPGPEFDPALNVRGHALSTVTEASLILTPEDQKSAPKRKNNYRPSTPILEESEGEKPPPTQATLSVVTKERTRRRSPPTTSLVRRLPVVKQSPVCSLNEKTQCPSTARSHAEKIQYPGPEVAYPDEEDEEDEEEAEDEDDNIADDIDFDEGTETMLTAAEHPPFKKLFFAYSRFGDTSSDGKQITLTNLDKWLKQGDVIDGSFITTTDTSILFRRLFKAAKKVGKHDFLRFIDALAMEKDVDGRELYNKLLHCGFPGFSGITRPSEAEVINRLTDITKYTGSHRYKFLGLYFRRAMAQGFNPAMTSAIPAYTFRQRGPTSRKEVKRQPRDRSFPRY